MCDARIISVEVKSEQSEINGLDEGRPSRRRLGVHVGRKVEGSQFN